MRCEVTYVIPMYFHIICQLSNDLILMINIVITISNHGDTMFIKFEAIGVWRKLKTLKAYALSIEYSHGQFTCIFK